MRSASSGVAQSRMQPPDNGNQVNPLQPRKSSHRPRTAASQSGEANRSRRESSDGGEEIQNSRSLALILDLSGNENAAMEWATSRLPGLNVRAIEKADLKWASKREALSRVRSMRPDTFCVFVPDLRFQSGRRTLMLFAMLAGARRVMIGDAKGLETSRSRFGILLLEAPRFAVELVTGYGLLVPLSWLLTEVLGFSLAFRGPVRVSRINRRGNYQEQRLSSSALYVRATLTSVSEGGMHTHVTGFASGAAALGHHLRFLVSGFQSERDDTVVIPPSPSFGATKALFELWNNLVFTAKSLSQRTALASDVDFIYQRYSRFNCTGVLLSAATALPLALEFNGSEVWISKRWDPIGLRWLLKRFERLNLQAADVIFVVSEVERLNLIEAGVIPAKIIVNPNGVDPDRFRPDCGGRDIRRALGIENQTVVGFIGTFGPWHGAPVLARAARLCAKEAGVHVIFIGAGEERALSEAIIESGAVSATFTGSLPHEKVPAYLDACDILASPHVASTDGSEFFGSPTKLFEYLAMGKGIVASRLGQVGELIIDGENGLLVEPGDEHALAQAIERLGVDIELRTRLGAAARKTASERYTWRHNAARVFDQVRSRVQHDEH
jgi:glycosyltransferase involved in cell wall biosynthesis